MRKLLLVLAIIAFSTSSYAWTFNHSYIDPNLLNNRCVGGITATPNGNPHDATCCMQTECEIFNGPNCVKTRCVREGTVQRQSFDQTVSVPIVNETCYHPTCYVRAATQVIYNNPVQPLTNSTYAITNTVNDLGIRNLLLYAFRYTTPIGLELNNTQRYFTQEVQYPQKWGVATGTSAMQGLLWSWRMLSPRWQGYWAGRSKFEGADDPNIALRNRGGTLPSVNNSKNVIIISDGIDSDGPDYNPGGRTINSISAGTITTPQGTVNKDDATLDAAPSLQQSPGFRAANSSVRTLSQLDVYETCDANVPLASFTRADYVQVCNSMKAQGIKVNVILYLYGANDITDGRLSECANITGGITITDATPANIGTKLRELVAQIVTRNIRLIR